MSGKKVAVFGIYSPALRRKRHGFTCESGFSDVRHFRAFAGESRRAEERKLEPKRQRKRPKERQLGDHRRRYRRHTRSAGGRLVCWRFPGLGPFIAAGPIMAGLAGLGVGGAVGGVTGALIGMGIPEFEAKRYEGRLQRAGFFFPYIATRLTKSSVPRKLWNGPVEKTFPPRAKRPRIAARQTATFRRKAAGDKR